MQSNMNPTMLNLIPLIFIFGVFYFLLIRPQQKKQKQHQAMLGSLKKNDEIVGAIMPKRINIPDNVLKKL